MTSVARLLALAALVASSHAFAQSYPNRPIKVIVPWPPGQATDVAARVVAEKMGTGLGQQLVIDNRAGAGGTIGTDVAAKSAPDGYTILAGSSGPMSISPRVQKVPYDPDKDLEPICIMASSTYVLVAPASVPAKNFDEFVAMLRASPGKYTFASSGTGATAHLVAESFNSSMGITASHVPYKGSAPAVTDSSPATSPMPSRQRRRSSAISSRGSSRPSPCRAIRGRSSSRSCRRRRKPGTCPVSTCARGSGSSRPAAFRAMHAAA